MALTPTQTRVRNTIAVAIGLGGGGATPPTLGTLTLSGSLQIGTATSGTINGATLGSTIAGNIPGITVNGAARTYAGTPTGTAATISNGLVETLAGATGSPKSSAVTVAAAAGGPILLSVATARVGQAYPGFSASGGSPPYTFAAITGLPAGLTSSSTLGATGAPTGV